MQIKDAVVLVTGGSRGLGAALAAEALARGARKVYATARDPRTVTNPDVVPLALEVTETESVAEVARQASDVTILVNNAGVSINSRFLDSDLADIRREFETNFYGPLHLCRAFVPGMVAGGGGHLLNINSALSWIALTDSYSASKAALWSMTNSLRLQLRPQGVGVTGLHVGYVDTDMVAHVDAPKVEPGDVARQALDGVEADAFEVLADDTARRVRAAQAAPVEALYPQLSAAA